MPELTFRLEEGPFHDISLYRLHFHMNIMYKEKLLCFTPQTESHLRNPKLFYGKKKACDNFCYTGIQGQLNRCTKKGQKRSSQNLKSNQVDRP